MTIGELKTRTRDRADAVGDTQWVTDAELVRYLDVGYCELVDLLLAADVHMFEVTSTVTTDGTNVGYDLPADLYKLLGVDYRWSASPARYVDVPVVTFGERNRYDYLAFSSTYGAYAAGYRLVGAQVQFSPLPPTGQVYRLSYMPAPAQFSKLANAWVALTVYVAGDTVLNGANIYTCTIGGTSAAAVGPTGTGAVIVDGTVTWAFSIVADDTVIDGIAGYDELLVVLAAMKMARKEGDSTGLRELARDRDELVARIAQSSVDRQPVQSIAAGRDDCDYDDRRYPYATRRWRD